MPRFRSKVVEIEAVQVCRKNWNRIMEMIGQVRFREWNPDGDKRASAHEISESCGDSGPSFIVFKVVSMQGEKVTVKHGDWLILERTPGLFYPCNPATFRAKYEPID